MIPARVLMLLTLLFFASCSFFNRDEEEEAGAGMAEQEIYQTAQRAIEANSFMRAITYLQALESQFPFGDYAEQAQLDIIYAQYRASDHEAALASADRFIRLHPEHPNVDYAYYMRGLINFTRETSFVGNFVPVDLTTRDPGTARESFANFSELLSRFPNSTYAPDARKRLIYIRNMLARQEIMVANYYFRRGAYLAATNRGQYVVENFQGSPAVPDGLAVMAQGYTLLGYHEQAQNAVKVLAHNYPDHPALNPDGTFRYQDMEGGIKRSWLNRLTMGMLDRPDELGFDTRELYNPQYQQPN
ncbi:MAG: outer membrane protein assembly factor BamD [Pseudomonadales bacterium]